MVNSQSSAGWSPVMQLLRGLKISPVYKEMEAHKRFYVFKLYSTVAYSIKLIIPGNFRIRALLRLISSDNSFLITTLECESTSENSGYNTKFFLVCYDAVHLLGINPLKMNKPHVIKVCWVPLSSCNNFTL